MIRMNEAGRIIYPAEIRAGDPALLLALHDEVIDDDPLMAEGLALAARKGGMVPRLHMIDGVTGWCWVTEPAFAWSQLTKKELALTDCVSKEPDKTFHPSEVGAYRCLGGLAGRLKPMTAKHLGDMLVIDVQFSRPLDAVERAVAERTVIECWRQNEWLMHKIEWSHGHDQLKVPWMDSLEFFSWTEVILLNCLEGALAIENGGVDW
jgi:hypothetical protein